MKPSRAKVHRQPTPSASNAVMGEKMAAPACPAEEPMPRAKP